MIISKLFSSRRLIWSLLIIDIVMALIALTVDLHDFFETPWYLWLWVPICSIYPFLLALNYGYFLKHGRFQPFMLSFTVFGVIGYGIIAPVFYGLYMREAGFAWYEFGNILWVWLYASQGILLWPFVREMLITNTLRVTQLLVIFGYFLIKDILDRFSVTWSYVRFGALSESTMNITFVTLLIVHFVLLAVFLRKSLHVSKNISSFLGQ